MPTLRQAQAIVALITIRYNHSPNDNRPIYLKAHNNSTNISTTKNPSTPVAVAIIRPKSPLQYTVLRSTDQPLNSSMHCEARAQTHAKHIRPVTMPMLDGTACGVQANTKIISSQSTRREKQILSIDLVIRSILRLQDRQSSYLQAMTTQNEDTGTTMFRKQVFQKKTHMNSFYNNVHLEKDEPTFRTTESKRPTHISHKYLTIPTRDCLREDSFTHSTPLLLPMRRTFEHKLICKHRTRTTHIFHFSTRIRGLITSISSEVHQDTKCHV